VNSRHPIADSSTQQLAKMLRAGNKNSTMLILELRKISQAMDLKMRN